jgi:hypothetical protein
MDMARLPESVRHLFCRVIDGELSPAQFGQWLIEDSDLERLMAGEDYFALVSINFSKKNALEKAEPILARYLRPGELLTHRLIELLHHTSWEDDRLPDLLLTTVDLYERGLTFLEPLALDFGEQIRHPVVGGLHRRWDDLSEREQDQIMKGFSPALDATVADIVGWLKSGDIEITSDAETGPLTFEDDRVAVAA